MRECFGPGFFPRFLASTYPAFVRSTNTSLSICAIAQRNVKTAFPIGEEVSKDSVRLLK